MKSGAGRGNTAKAIGEANHDRKVDPSLSAAFEPWRPKSPQKSGFELYSPGQVQDGAAPSEERAEREVFITFEGDHRRFKNYGVVTRAVEGNIATARVSKAGLDALSDDRDVLYVEESRPVSVEPQALPGSTDPVFPWLSEIGALELQTHLAASPDRCKVIVGVVDVHDIDVNHPDFFRSDDSTKILSIWDQTRSSEGGHKFLGYGTEHNNLHINKELTQAGRTIPCYGGHGTAVAGIAAGNAGVAPQADILYVRTAESGPGALSAMTNLADALYYIFRRADELARPCVVCVSLGDTLGPHDGTSPVERFIDNLLSKPGRAICISAGNFARSSQTTGKHVTGSADKDGFAEIAFDVPAGVVSPETFEIWCSGDDEIELVVEAPFVPDMPKATGPIHADEGPRLYELAGATMVLAGAVRRYPPNGESYFRIEIFPKRGSISEGRWKIKLLWRCLVDGSFNGWIDSNTSIRWSGDGQTLDRITILSPATSRFAMTVGSYDVDQAGASATSGFGPTRDGRLKPDVAAPGNNIMAASAGTAKRYLPTHGTSVAAPQVAGAIALLFELYGPFLCMEDAKLLLGAIAEKKGISSPDNRLGHGRLRLGEAASWAKAKPGEVWLPKHDRDQGGVPYVGPSPWVSPCIEVSNGNLTIEGDHEVTVKPRWERGGAAGALADARVHLYWSDGASYVAEDRWRSDGIFAGGEQRNVQEIKPGQDAVFRIRPSRVKKLGAPARLINLKAHIETEGEQRRIGPHPLGRYQNNVAVRSVHRASSGDADLGFWLTLPADDSDLRLDASNLGGAEVTLRLPIGVIDLNAFPVFARALGTTFEEVPFEEHISLAARATIAEVLKGEEIIVRDPDILRAAGIEGAVEVKVSGTFTDIVVRPNEGGVLKATIDRLRGAPGHLMPARLIVRGAPMRTHDGRGTHLDMAHLARGAPIGGLRIEFRAA